ncbi:MAG: universal stress protein [Acidimicrobiia bacterium]|nr:universal stress protein [Acidimicrobiia bacterium]
MIVVVGVDEAPISKTVLERGIQEAKWRDAEVHAVHVLQIPIVYGEFPVEMGHVSEAQRRAVWEPLESTIAGAGIHVERVDLDGYPPDVLVRYASGKEAALIAVGTRGRGAFASLVLGSTSLRTIHLAECDVLVVKPAETEEE